MSQEFPLGVGYYTSYLTNIVVSFTEDRIACGWCSRKLEQGRNVYCKLTEEKIAHPEQGIGLKCPLHNFSELIEGGNSICL